MARSGVTEHQVHQAADALLRAGERPTIERVRATLGTGSPNTVVRLLDSWWAALSRRLDDQAAKLALADAPAAVVDAASAMWTSSLQHAMALAHAELAADRAALEVQREAHAKLCEETSAHVDRAEKELLAARDAAHVSEIRHADVERLANDLTRQVSDLKLQRDALSQEREILQRAVDVALPRANALTEEFTQERKRLEGRMRATEDRWMQEVDRARVETAKLQQRLGQMESTLDSTRRDTQRERDASLERLRAAEQQRAAAESRAATLEAELARHAPRAAGHGGTTAVPSA